MLGALYAQLGPAQAEDMVCRALEEVARRLTNCEAYYRQGEWAKLRKDTRALIAIADQIGMAVLARVAANVTECIDAQDANALAATLARLFRIGERSLTAIWDIEGLPG